jgi:hypothetical protein
MPGSVNTSRNFPDAFALDLHAFYENFTGLRSFLPYWYRDVTGPTKANPNYLDGVTDSTRLFITYAHEDGEDAPQFQWTDDPNLNWMEFTEALNPKGYPEGFDRDGVLPRDGGHYILWQDPSFAGLVQLNTTPFMTSRYNMLADLDTKGEFKVPDNREINAATNAMIVWIE